MKSSLITCLLAGATALSSLQAQAPPPSLFRSMAASDPNRDPNWDFWTNRPYTFYYYKDGVINHTYPPNDSLPYFRSGHATSANDGNPDVRPEDGWMLVIRDFGTPTQAPAFPYFALYNKYRGILRFFFLNSWGLQNSQYATSVQLFNPSQEQYRSALLTFPAETKAFLKDYDSAQQIYTMANMTLNGWSHYDFILSGYDPTLATKPFVGLDIKTIGLNVSNLKMTGNIYGTLEQMMNNAPASFGRSELETLEAALGKGYKYYKTTDDAMKALKKSTDDQANEDGTRYVYPVLGGYQATTTKLPNVVINPVTGMATQSVKYAFKYETRGPSAYTDAPQAFSLQSPVIPTGLTYELKAILPNATTLKHSDPVQVFYKTVPYKRIDGEPIGWFEPYVN